MSTWRKSAINSFPESKEDFLAMTSVEEVWPFLRPKLEAAVKQRDAITLGRFFDFAEWAITPRPGSRPGNSLNSLTTPVVTFIQSHVNLIFAGRSRQDFFRLQPGLKYHLSQDEMRVFDTFLESTTKYVA